MPGASAKPVISSVFHKRFRLPTRITTQNDKFVKSLGRGTMLVCDGSGTADEVMPHRPDEAALNMMSAGTCCPRPIGRTDKATSAHIS